MSAAIGLVALVLMLIIARRADRHLAPGQSSLPMNFAPDGSVLWRAPRRVALGFMPMLGALIILPSVIFAPATAAAPIAGLALLGGQLFFHWLIGRAR